MAIVERRRIYEGSRIPSPIPTVLSLPSELEGSEDVLRVNFGPNHPSTHGVLRLIVDLDGENVVGLASLIGYLHTGFEKNMEHKTWWKAITYPERIDYVGFQNDELVFVLAIEKLLGLEIPPKATWMRMLLCELNRIHSHLVFLGTGALELGAISMFWYCFRERDLCSIFSSWSPGSACTRGTSRPAAWPRTSRPASSPRRAGSATGCRRRSTTTRR